ncbi:glycosyltransferase family 39 protein [Kribbella solani]|uniref:glycosyltransferase family 39 protein n=1 Tax=Kribbella solani TaxID=236067 RepID=UPI0029A91FCC|nr:glycosyltransferase family 39 protein [Kribbella solani]MDX3001746.1 glycosyltransferase family 39 protein [Kribbella solani]
MTIRTSRAAYVALLVLTAIGYLWGLSRNGFANEYYAAAVQAGSISWKAWFFAAFDAPGFITVDKTPGAMWVMGLSARAFGFSSWSMLLPQALMGVATVAVLYACVRRWFGARAALLAGVIMAVTPVAVLMFRFNNPDALLVLLLTSAAYAVTRAISSEQHPARWMMLAGALVGFAFLTKMTQAFLVLPALALAYLLAGRKSVRVRVRDTALAGIAMVVGGGWWIAIVELMPASARPYIDGSRTNSIVELALGYNGLSRLSGSAARSGPSAEVTGLQRLLDPEYAGQILWLLPVALISAVALVSLERRSRAFVVLWAGWLVVTGAVFVLMDGTVHSYYLIALAPPIAALSGPGLVLLWSRRDHPIARSALSGAALLTAGISFGLLSRASAGVLPYTVLIVGVLAAGLLLVNPSHRRFRVLIAGLLVATALTGPLTYSIQTIGVRKGGTMPTAGPDVSSGGGRSGALISGTATSQVPAELIALLEDGASGYTWAAAAVSAHTAAPLELAAGRPVIAIGGFNGTNPAPTLTAFQQLVAKNQIRYFIDGTSFPNAITTWVKATFEPTTVGGATVYDLTALA